MQTVEVHDEVMPEDKWGFDSDVTDAFDDMLLRSIPQYEVMRRACFDLASHYRREGDWIIDLGCSRGGAMAQLIDRFGAHNKYYGCDVSQPMLQAARGRFDGFIETGIVEIEELDLRTSYPSHAASVTLCVLTLQFTPIEYRQRILQNVYNHTVDGGVLILVEKVLGSHPDVDDLMIKLYYELKAQHGYTTEQIERKRLSLEGVLVPVKAGWNEELLRNSGFRKIDCFWRWMNFAGWIAEKWQ